MFQLKILGVKSVDPVIVKRRVWNNCERGETCADLALWDWSEEMDDTILMEMEEIREDSRVSFEKGERGRKDDIRNVKYQNNEIIMKLDPFSPLFKTNSTWNSGEEKF